MSFIIDKYVFFGYLAMFFRKEYATGKECI